MSISNDPKPGDPMPPMHDPIPNPQPDRAPPDIPGNVPQELPQHEPQELPATNPKGGRPLPIDDPDSIDVPSPGPDIYPPAPVHPPTK